MFDALKTMIFGGKPAKERRRLVRASKRPAINVYITKQQIAIKVTEPMTTELWDWLVLMGWREVDIKSNRRKITRLHDETFSKLANAKPVEREAVYRAILNL
ncbi:MAG: hypothetical protein WC009_04750 [Methylotenera sp.]